LPEKSGAILEELIKVKDETLGKKDKAAVPEPAPPVNFTPLQKKDLGKYELRDMLTSTMNKIR